MVKVSVMYPNHEGTKFDMTYYINRHIPIVRQLLGSALRGVLSSKEFQARSPDRPPLTFAMGHLLFDSVEAFQTSFGPHAQAIMEDIPNYTNSEPIVQISEVKL